MNIDETVGYINQRTRELNFHKKSEIPESAWKYCLSEEQSLNYLDMNRRLVD